MNCFVFINLPMSGWPGGHLVGRVTEAWLLGLLAAAHVKTVSSLLLERPRELNAPPLCSPACRIQRTQSTGWKKTAFSLCSSSVELGDLGRYLQAVQVKMDVEWFLLSAKKVKEGKSNPPQVASRCVANGMLIDSTQKEIRDVNVLEKIIIQITTSSSDTSMIEY